jgi:hypothetical protein
MHATIVASDPRRPRLTLAVEGSSDEVWDAVWRARSLYRQVEWTIGVRPASQAAELLEGSTPRPEWLRELMARPEPGIGAVMDQLDQAVEERRVARQRSRAAS